MWSLDDSSSNSVDFLKDGEQTGLMLIKDYDLSSEDIELAKKIVAALNKESI